MKTIHRKWVESKIAAIDKAIDELLESNKFLEAQDLELELTYYENKLLNTYDSRELNNLFKEGYPEIA